MDVSDHFNARENLIPILRSSDDLEHQTQSRSFRMGRESGREDSSIRFGSLDINQKTDYGTEGYANDNYIATDTKFASDVDDSSSFGFGNYSKNRDIKPILKTPNHTGESSTSTPSLKSNVPKGRRYPLFICPSSKEGMSNICFKLIGSGQNICIKQNCRNSHKGVIASITPGEAFVKRGKDKIFANPSIDLNKVDSDTVTQWIYDRKPVEEWKSIFQAINVSFAKQPRENKRVRLNKEDIEKEKSTIATNLMHRTPMKRVKTEKILKIESDVLKSTINIPNMENEIDGNLLRTTLLELNNKINETVSYFTMLQHDREQDAKDQYEFSLATETKLDKIVGDIGTKSDLIDAKFDDPNIWSAIGSICESLENNLNADIVGDIISTVSQGRTKLHALSSRVNEKLNLQDIKSEKQENMINRHMNNCNSIFSLIKSDLDALVSRLLSLESLNSPNLGTQRSMNALQSHTIEQLKNEIFNLSNSLESLKNKDDAMCIRYHQLGFRNFRDASAFFDAHNPGDNFGLIVAFHIALENITNRLIGEEITDRLKKLVKIKLTDIGQYIAMESFKKPMPRFFSGNKPIVLSDIVGSDESHFKGIPDFDSWDRTHVGLKARLEMSTEEFRESQMSKINNLMTTSNPMHALATASVSDSCSFILLLITFIDNTYRDYKRAKFSPKKAWHITTLLSKKLINKIYQPRIGVGETFYGGHPRDIGKAIFYASLKSLDMMSNIRETGMANDPSISSELVKYLAMNTEFDTIIRLKEENGQLKKEMIDLKKDLKEAQKAASTIGNKSDSLKSSLEALTRRVKTLEK